MLPYAIVDQVNSYENQHIEYAVDYAQYQKLEYWEPATRKGDCEDYALAKRKKLMELGAKRNDLHIALAYIEAIKMPHVVLVAVTNKGEFVLDNRYPLPMPKQLLPYKWMAIQEGGVWRAIISQSSR